MEMLDPTSVVFSIISGKTDKDPSLTEFLHLDAEFAIQGQLCIDADSSLLTSTFNSVLYICPEEAADCGIEGGGFSVIASQFPKNMAVIVSLIPSDTIFQPEFYKANSKLAIHTAMAKFMAVKQALDALPRPTLIMCNRLGGLVWATYTGAKQGKSPEQVLSLATERGLSYVGSAGFVAWSSAVLSNVHNTTAVATTVSSTLLHLDSEFAIQGCVPVDAVSSLSESFASVLYLCPDEAGDSGIEGGAGGGFGNVLAAFSKDTAVFEPLIPSGDIFQPDLYQNQTSKSLAIQAAMTKFESLKQALDVLPRPTLILCKSNRRAGMVWATYTGAKQGKSPEQVLSLATERGLSYVGSAGFVAWSSAVLSNVHNSTAVATTVGSSPNVPTETDSKAENIDSNSLTTTSKLEAVLTTVFMQIKSCRDILNKTSGASKDEALTELIDLLDSCHDHMVDRMGQPKKTCTK